MPRPRAGLPHPPDLDGYIGEDMGGETVQSVMDQFMGFAQAPQFIIASVVK